MKDSFIKVAACSPPLKVGDCAFNTDQMALLAREAAQKGVKLLAFPELGVTGYSCGDLFFQSTLLDSAWQAVETLMDDTAGLDIILVFGMPVMMDGHLLNCAVVLNCATQTIGSTEPRGLRLGGIIPKVYPTIPEKRWFSPQPLSWHTSSAEGVFHRPDRDGLFCIPGYPELTFGIEICNDMWVADPPATRLCAAGANLIINLSASDEGPGKAVLRRTLISAHSRRNHCAYIYTSSGPDESTTDMVFGGHRIIAECGQIIAEDAPFSDSLMTITDIDLGRIAFENRRVVREPEHNDGLCKTYLPLQKGDTPLHRQFSRLPFIEESGANAEGGWQHLLNIQAHGLRKRLLHTGCQTAILGISGGLDSTLALLVTERAFQLAGLDRAGILAYTLPCFGTSELTKSNAYKLCKALDLDITEIDISPAVRQHFADIGQPEGVYDAAFENAQARERTQVLMDIANRKNGLVIGTGDMSELALGWATYNGDHMSMYGVNGGVPKTLMRFMLESLAADTDNAPLAAVLRDVVATPVSPELLPTKEGQIAQKTEDVVGPYELHDFFLFHALGRGAGPRKLFGLASQTFGGSYDAATIHRWLTVFFRRFFSQQFKRSCMPDGAGVGLLSLSPRGGLVMPSDAVWGVWQRELEAIAPATEQP